MAVDRRLFNLLAFILLAVGACATPQPTPLSALPSPTVTTVPPTATSIPSTATPLPTDTPEPTATASLSHTATPLPPTETPLPTTPEPTSSSSPWPSLILDDLGVSMVLVPAGPFVMGSDQGSANAPPHTVTLDAYYIDRYEVTNAQFAGFLDEFGNQSQEGIPWLHVSSSSNHLHEDQGTWQPDEGYADHPVVEVTWYGANAYCQWRGAHLPSEAEWEKAARGTDERTYPWGEEITCDVTNYRPCSIGESVPVGSYPEGASPYGVHDMAGNVGEWTGDWYDSDYYRTAPAKNPPGPVSSPGNRIASRGGSWYSGSTYLRTFHRNNEFKPTDTLRNIGFRCAMTPAEVEQSGPATTLAAPTAGFVSEIDLKRHSVSR